MNSRKPSRHVSWAHKPNPSFACSPPCNSSVLIDTSAEQKWPPIVESRKPSRHVFWAHKPNPSFVCSPPNDSSVFIAALTLWPSGQGVGLLSPSSNPTGVAGVAAPAPRVTTGHRQFHKLSLIVDSRIIQAFVCFGLTSRAPLPLAARSLTLPFPSPH